MRAVIVMEEVMKVVWLPLTLLSGVAIFLVNALIHNKFEIGHVIILILSTYFIYDIVRRFRELD